MLEQVSEDVVFDIDRKHLTEGDSQLRVTCMQSDIEQKFIDKSQQL